MAVKTAVNMIKADAMPLAGGQADIQYLLRNRKEHTHLPVKGADPRDQIALLIAERPLTVVAVTLVPEDTQSADADMNSLVLLKADGAGGPGTSFDSIDSTSTDYIEARKISFSINEATDKLAAGEVLFLDYTLNGTGATLIPAMTLHVEYRID